MSSRALTIDDIADLRAYERERDETRRQMTALRSRRRVALGTVVSVAFENRQTIRYQIQEMARVERIVTDHGIQDELDAYNPLVPERGQLRATLFVELTSDEQLRQWLPRLVGIERHLAIKLPDGELVRATVDPGHASQLTRESVTAAVHYIGFDFTESQVARFGDGAALLCDHEHYQHHAELLPSVVAELRSDLTD